MKTFGGSGNSLMTYSYMNVYVIYINQYNIYIYMVNLSEPVLKPAIGEGLYYQFLLKLKLRMVYYCLYHVVED